MRDSSTAFYDVMIPTTDACEKRKNGESIQQDYSKTAATAGKSASGAFESESVRRRRNIGDDAGST